MAIKLNDLDVPPEVGEEYLVPHVRCGDEWLPTLGPDHADPSFAPELGQHTHYDPRFIPERQVLVRVAGLQPAQAAMVIAHRLRGGEEREERPARCLRAMPAFPRGNEAAPWVPELERSHAGCRVRDGRCPHAGTDGRSFPRAADGSWECIHGLRWGADGSLRQLADDPIA